MPQGTGQLGPGGNNDNDVGNDNRDGDCAANLGKGKKWEASLNLDPLCGDARLLSQWAAH